MTILHPASSPVGAIVPPAAVDGPHVATTSDRPGSRIAPPPLPRPLLPPAGPAAGAARPEYAVGTLGANGRLSERSTLRRLGWEVGTRLDLREDHGLIVVRADPRAAFRIGAQGFLLLPSTLRRWCRLADGDRVLLVADLAAAWLVIHPPAAVAAMVAAAHDRAWGGGDR